MPRRFMFVMLIALLAVVVAATGCPKKDKVAPEPPEPVRQQAEPAPVVAEPPVTEVTEPFPSEPVDAEPEEQAPPSIDELNRRGVLQTVFFAYDSSELGSTAKATLQANAAWLGANPGYNIVIQGHCDERGTIEYNLALGERRATAVRDYLASLGVAPSRMRIVTYGEERPADPGHTEAAWAKNRRGIFVIES